MKKIYLGLLAVMISAAILLSGCFWSRPSQSLTQMTEQTSTSVISSTSGVTTSATAPKTTTTTNAPVAGNGTLRLYSIDPITLDPAVAAEVNSHQYITQVFNGLVQLDDKLEVVPDLAERWDLSPDSLTYTFYLRSGLKFRDGHGLTAADVQFSWERACQPQTGSTTAATYLGDIAGSADVRSGKTMQLSGVRAIDDTTLTVTIDAPKSYFLAKLTYPTAFVVDKNNVASGSDWWRQPNGAGPFNLKDWQKNTLLVLERNENYYGSPAGVKEVDFELYAGSPMDLYETGEIDAVAIGVEYIDKATDKSGSLYRELLENPELSFYYLAFNCRIAPFDDARVRQAFVMAVDRDKLVSLVLKNTAQRAKGILPPGMPGYNESLIGPAFNPARAKELIGQSKYGSVSNLPSITITTGGQGGLISAGLEAIIEQWRENLGVEVKVRQVEIERFMYHLDEEVDQMYESGWVADYPHPQDFLDILFRSGADNNYGGYSNPRADALLDQAAPLPEAQGFTLYQQVEQMLVDDAACLPLWFGQAYTLVKQNVSGYHLNALGLVRLHDVTVN
jgi:oligopeptide transport system substrate-binding protein